MPPNSPTIAYCVPKSAGLHSRQPRHANSARCSVRRAARPRVVREGVRVDVVDVGDVAVVRAAARVGVDQARGVEPLEEGDDPCHVVRRGVEDLPAVALVEGGPLKDARVVAPPVDHRGGVAHEERHGRLARAAVLLDHVLEDDHA